MERIHDQIRQGSYRVDAEAVAEAILRRLLESRGLVDAPSSSSSSSTPSSPPR